MTIERLDDPYEVTPHQLELGWSGDTMADTVDVALEEQRELARHHWPFLDEKRTDYPMMDKDFLHELWQVNASRPFTGKIVFGINHEDYNKLFAEFTYRLRAINPALTPEFLMPGDYQSNEVRQALGQLTTLENSQVHKLRSYKHYQLDYLAHRLARKMQHQSIGEGMLTKPGYIKAAGSKTCTQATFQMIFEDIAQEEIRQGNFYDAVRDAHKHHIVDDEEYLKVLTSPEFQDHYGIHVRTVSLLATDLEQIDELAAKVKGRIPEAKIYAAVSLKSELLGHHTDAWHNAVLTGVDRDTAYLNDPVQTESVTGPRRVRKEKFLQRWLVASARTHLIIATPAD